MNPPVEGEEPRATIYVPAWLDARDRLVGIEDEDARALLASAIDQVESGWDAVRAVQRCADQSPEAERTDDDYGALLTFAESEMREVFRAMAFNLAAWVEAWPGGELPPDKDVDGRLSEFGRYVAVLVLATDAAVGVPDAFRAAVRKLARLRPDGEWARRLAATFAVIQGVSDAELTADSARQAVDFLLQSIPEAERERLRGVLIGEVAAIYAGADQESPAWLRLLKDYFPPLPPEPLNSGRAGGEQ